MLDPSTASSDSTTCPTLTGPNNYKIWKLQITVKLQREKVLGIALGTDSKPGKKSDQEEVRKWTECDEKAQGIIQDHISDALLIKTQSHTSTKDLFEALVKLHEVSHLSSAFHLYCQLLDSTWDGASEIGRHMAGIRTIGSRLAGMKFTINPKLLAFTLLNSLPKTAEWGTFTSALINSVDPAKLTFDDLETCIVTEAGRLNPSGTAESGLAAKGKPGTRIGA